MPETHPIVKSAQELANGFITVVIDVAIDFSNCPGGRFKTDGPHSAERLRDDLIAPALSRGVHLVVRLDNTYGFGSSFLEEAFGGLVRDAGYTARRLRSVLTIETKHPDVAAKVWRYIDEADGRAADAALLAGEAFAE